MPPESTSSLFPPLPNVLAGAESVEGRTTSPLSERVLDPAEYGRILETICGATDDSQDVELYDGTLGVSTAFVASRERPVGQVAWNSNLANK